MIGRLRAGLCGFDVFVLVTRDADFIELAAVWVRREADLVVQRQSLTEVVEEMLRDNAEAMAAFETDDASLSGNR